MNDEPILKRISTYSKYVKPPEWVAATIHGPKKPWGGKRKGAGRPRKSAFTDTIKININNIQRMSLEEMGDGDIAKGIEKLIGEYL